MKVLVFEENLMWSSRLLQSIRGLGHEAILKKEIPTDGEGARAAIINLGESKLDLQSLVDTLKSFQIEVIGHAGHKEKEVLELGRAVGVSRLTTNSELTFKIGDILASIETT